MVEKSFCETLGSRFWLGFGLLIGCDGGQSGWWGSEGHLMRGLPGTESYDWS